MTIVEILEAGNVPHQVNPHELKFDNKRKKKVTLCCYLNDYSL